MAKRLFASLTRPVTLNVSRPLFLALSAVSLALLILGVAAAAAPLPTTCQGVCQCWYWPDYEWIDGHFVTHGPCDHGCAGACAYNDRMPWLPGSCSQVPGQGGCGPICNCRDGDCGGGPNPTTQPPTPVAPPTEPPIPPECPAPGEVREWTKLIPPKIGSPTYRPDHPVVVDQDPNKTGFELHLTFDGGRYEYKTQRLEKVCDDQPEPINGTPQPCRAWHYECPIRCTACYDDPLAAAQIRMRLADPTLDWIQQELAARYPGAQPKEGLPRTWQIAGVADRMHYDAWWRYAPRQPDLLSNGPIDPGTHGGKLVVWTTGTPRSAPQVVERGFEVPVFLLDTTIAK